MIGHRFFCLHKSILHKSVKELVMDSLDRLVGVLLVDENGDLDLAGADHLDVDLSVVERLEHLGGNTGVALHARADDRDLGDLVVIEHFLGAEVLHVVLQAVDRLLTSGLGYREADVLESVVADGLEDDVDIDALCGKL